MNIGLTAHNSKKTLLESFCIAYKGIFKKHTLIATNATANHIAKATGMKVTSLLPGQMGGSKQMQNMIANNDIDLVIFFHSADLEQDAESMNLAEISRLCDMYNIPLATTSPPQSHLYCVLTEVIWSGEITNSTQLCTECSP